METQPPDAILTGAFFADGNFVGGTTASQTDKQLVIYGTVGADIDLNGAGPGQISNPQLSLPTERRSDACPVGVTP